MRSVSIPVSPVFHAGSFQDGRNQDGGNQDGRVGEQQEDPK